MEASVNTLIDDLLWPTSEVARALAAVAQGDLLQTVRLDVNGRPLRGEFLQSANIVNTMIRQLGVVTSEVTRVAREVGTEGKLGGQAQVPGATGTWKDLTESVNSMASNLTAQVRNVADVTLTSKFKSEFLANMSHELRTPLNSILILGQQLGDNPDGNLTPRQVEFVRTIHGVGTDLLNLISDILDLSKIESGTVTVDVQEVLVADLLDATARTFRHEAEARQLALEVSVDPKLDRSIFADSKRLQQVLKNLLSNAFKFTEHGSVRLSASAAITGWSADQPILNHSPAVVSFEVSDTGIGIPLDKQKIIFEAFQQADASTSRKYGGPGLGLAICRELSQLLGGEIQLRSSPGGGSRFTLYLPIKYSAAPVAQRTQPEEAPARPHPNPVFAPVVPERPPEQLPDDRHSIEPGDMTLLIVEDDPHYARVIMDLARDKGFKVLVSARGADAVDLAKQFQPTAISLDVFLPDMLGWSVLSQLEKNPLTRHIPVQVVTLDEDRQHALAHGAYSFVTKPVSTEGIEAVLLQIKDFAKRRQRRLLVVEDNAAEQLGVAELLGHNDIGIVTVPRQKIVAGGNAVCDDIA